MKFHLTLLSSLMIPFLLFGCAARPVLLDTSRAEQNLLNPVPEVNENEDPRLVLTAYPSAGFSPMRVTFHAELKNVGSKNPQFDCLWESWSFGDGSRSSQRVNCQNPEVSTVFVAEHVYKSEGIYQIRFALGDRVLISNPVHVRVIK